MKRAVAGGLWRNPDFLKLWTGETISLFGSQITAMALPLAAIHVFQVTELQMGLLNAFHFLPYLLVVLFAGVWVDRVRRRPILVGANAGRAVLLSLIPIGYLLGFLRFEHLYVITFLAGLLTMVFELAYMAYFPVLVGHDSLVEGNSKLQGSASVAEVSGPGLTGVLIHLVTAPGAILLDAISFLVSALCLTWIRQPEPKPQQPAERPSIFSDVAAGLRFVYTHPYLRAIALEAGTFNFFSNATWAVMLIYLTRELHFEPMVLGLVLGSASLGSLAGSVMATRVGAWLGTGPAILGSMALACAAPLMVPLATGPNQIVIPVIMVSFFLGGAGVTTSVVHVLSLRQAITPRHLQGRVAASYRFVSLGLVPLGAAFGGFLGSEIGSRATLMVSAVGTIFALGWVLFSPLRTLRHLPAPEAVAA